MTITIQKTAPGPGVQYAALPYRRDDKDLRILLVTSRDTGRWVIPKGWPMKGRTPHDAAAQEALEEAGIEGRVAKSSLGFYRYQKRLPDGTARPCTVHVFALEVVRRCKTWREKGQRTAKWFTLEEAAHAVQEPELQDLIHVFGMSHGVAPSCEDGHAVARSLGFSPE
jgi:8-oxo-dGTP pyrophosphatase MutT (NUDIX family)